MYSQEFWDNIYKEHYEDAPWMNDTWKNGVRKSIEYDLKTYLKDLEGRWLLDYGCGNGHMGVLFLKYGLHVDLADISKVLVKKLTVEYQRQQNIHVFQAHTPSNLPEDRTYDIIIACNLFHHLHPSEWHKFLSEFSKKTKDGGLFFVSGWDKNDDVIKCDDNKARFTQQDTWFINDLKLHIDDIPFKLIKDEQLIETVPIFEKPRVFRYFIFKKEGTAKLTNKNTVI